MFTSRAAIRTSRTFPRGTVRPLRNTRFQSSSSSSKPSNGGFNPALTGGIAGGATTFVAGYLWYHFSGAKTIVQTSKQMQDYFETTKQKVKESTPEPNDALKWLRDTSMSYAQYFPGASGYVETVFNDLDAVRNKHKDEVDSIVRDAYEELKAVSNQKFSMQTAQQAWQILEKHLKRIMELAGDASQDILNNHPELKEKVGGSFDQLKQLGDQLGPEAKKQVDQTWDQIGDVLKSGISVTTADKIRKIVQEKVEVVKKMGDEAWKKGMDKAKPYLDKNPKVKQLVEENKSSLMQGNVQELWDKVKSAVDSGDTSDLENYVKSASDKAKQQGWGRLDQYINAVPGGDQILPKLSELSDIAQKHGQEAENLLKETVNEISQVLSKKSQQAQDLANKASKS